MKTGPPVGPVLTLFRSRQLWSERSARSLSLFLGIAKRRAVRLLKKYMTLLLNPLYISSIRKLFVAFQTTKLLSVKLSISPIHCLLCSELFSLEIDTVQFSHSVLSNSCPTHCHPHELHTPGLPVLHHLSELALPL